MYKINLYLKLFIIFLLMIVIAMTYNYYILWALLIALSIFNFFFNNKKVLLIDFVLISILLLSYVFHLLLYVYRIAYIISLLFTLKDILSSKEKRFFKQLFKGIDKKSRRQIFYEQKYNYVLDTNRKLSNDIYKIDLISEEKINSDLERHYLQSKIRFNGYCDLEEKKIKFKWRKRDTLILIISIILFIICIIYR